MNMKKILLALGVGAIGFFLWKKFSKKKDSTTKSFSGGDDFYNASGNTTLRNGGYYSFKPTRAEGFFPVSPYTKMLGLNKNIINTTKLLITDKISGKFFNNPNLLSKMGYSSLKLKDGIIVISNPIKFRGLVVPKVNFVKV